MRSPALAAYLAISRLAGPLAGPVLRRRLSRGKEDPARWPERLGQAGLQRPPGRLAWLHAASVGEANSALPLVHALRARRLSVLVTTGTVTSAARMAATLPDGALHQFAPVDTAQAVGRFLDHWRPDLAVWIESELWPRLVVEAAARGVPMALVNARLSARSARRWGRLPGMARRMLSSFRLVLTQDEETVARVRALGGRARFAGNLKALVAPPPCEGAELSAIRAALAGRPVWLAASTHPGEEALALAAHGRLTAARAATQAIGAPAQAATPAADVHAGAGVGSAWAAGSDSGCSGPARAPWRDHGAPARGTGPAGPDGPADADGVTRGGVAPPHHAPPLIAPPERALPDRALPDRAPSDHAPARRAPPDCALPDRAPPDRATPGHATSAPGSRPVALQDGGAPLLLLAPRHPHRGDEVVRLIGGAGLRAARRSAGEVPDAATDVWLTDTLGEMGLWYGLAQVAFVGGSLVPVGGHTPFEPVQLGCAVLHGPHVTNFAPAYAALDAAGGAVQIGDAEALARAVQDLLADPAATEAMRGRAQAAHAALRPDLDTIADELFALMETS